MLFDQSLLRKYEKNAINIITVCKTVFECIEKIKCVKGKISSGGKGVIFVCNHRKGLDIPICYSILNVSPRLLTKREFEFSPIGRLLRFMGTIFVNRADNKSGKQAQNLMIQTLLHGGNILLFPEGTRDRTNKELLPFKMGAAYMAQVTGSAIVPIVIHQTGKRCFSVSIGEEVRVDVLDNLERANEELRKRMRGMLYKLGS